MMPALTLSASRLWRQVDPPRAPASRPGRRSRARTERRDDTGPSGSSAALGVRSEIPAARPVRPTWRLAEAVRAGLTGRRGPRHDASSAAGCVGGDLVGARGARPRRIRGRRCQSATQPARPARPLRSWDSAERTARAQARRRRRLAPRNRDGRPLRLGSDAGRFGPRNARDLPARDVRGTCRAPRRSPVGSNLISLPSRRLAADATRTGHGRDLRLAVRDRCGRAAPWRCRNTRVASGSAGRATRTGASLAFGGRGPRTTGVGEAARDASAARPSRDEARRPRALSPGRA